VKKEKFDNITRALGLCVCVIGISGAIKGDAMLLIVSLAVGTLAGELINIDGALNKLGGFLQSKFAKKSEDNKFAEGFLSASLLFCVGAMSIVGSISAGLSQDYSVIFTKSILDGVSAIIFASTFGVGVLFSAAVILLYQGSIELFAGVLAPFLSDALVLQLSAAGSVMIFALGINMVLKSKLKTANMLPGLAVAVVYYLVVM
jgi:Uncharacterized membrane protein, possible Na+ channel or pump